MTESWNTHGGRIVALTVVAALLFSLGEWLGEDLVAVPRALVPLALPVSIAGGVVAAIGLLLAWQRGGVRRFVTLVLVLSVSLGGGYWVGHRVSVSAFNDCVVRGESLRRALDDYRRAHGRYPRTLAELPARQVPGHRLTRGPILEYRSDRVGYALVFRDWLVRHEATETSSFVAMK